MQDCVMIDPDGAELYLDDGGKPCLRLVEALGRIKDDRRIGAAGAYIERFNNGQWEYVEGPFFLSLGGFSHQALAALEKQRRLTTR